MRCLVTGGMGFIGSYTCQALLDAGHQVVAFDRMPEGNTFDRAHPPATKSRLTVVAGDVLDLEHLIDAIRRHRIDTIVHLAAILTAESYRDPVLATRVNCEGTAQVFEAARVTGVRRVVWASSISVWYGWAPFPEDREVPNDFPHRPDDIYGASKAFNEGLGQVYAREFGVANIGLRFAHGTGAGRTRGGGAWAREIVDKPALGEPSVLEHGDELENWLSVEDQAAAVVAACTADIAEPFAVYTVAGFDIQPRRAAAEYVRQLLPDAHIEVRPGKLGRPVRYDTRPMERATGWRARFDMKATLRSMINRVRALHGLPPVG